LLKISQKPPGFGNLSLLSLCARISTFVVSVEKKAYVIAVEVDEDPQKHSVSVQICWHFMTKCEVHPGDFFLTVPDAKFK
jgi:predicted lipoprotein